MLDIKNDQFFLKKIKKILISILNLVPLSSAVVGTPRNCKSSKFFIGVNNSVLLSSLKYDNGTQKIKQPFINVLKETVHFTKLQHHKIPDQFILKLVNGRVWGVNGTIITNNDVFICDINREFGVKNNCKDHSVFNVAFQKNQIGLKAILQ